MKTRLDLPSPQGKHDFGVSFRDNKSQHEIIKEFRTSAIPDYLTLANVCWIEGNDAIQILTEEAIAKVQKVQSYITKPASRVLEKYCFASAGGWLGYGYTVDGGSGQVPYFKPEERGQL